jgi:hypothetical protein
VSCPGLYGGLYGQNLSIIIPEKILHVITVPGQEKYYNRLDMDPNTSLARYNSIQQ